MERFKKILKKLLPFLTSYFNFEDFAKEIKKRKCTAVKGEYFSRPLLQPRVGLINELDERIIGEVFYIKLSSCGDKIIYLEMVEVEKELKGEFLKKEKLDNMLRKRIGELKELLSPYTIEVSISGNDCKNKINTKGP